MKKMIQYINIYKFLANNVFEGLKVKLHVNYKIYSSNLILDDYDFEINKKIQITLDLRTDLVY